MKSTRAAEFFHVGGTLGEDAPSYVERAADQELLDALNDQALCLVLAPRQMGKSSLMIHAIAKLNDNGKRSGYVDLQLLGGHTELNLWLRDVVYEICKSLALNIDIMKWWEDDGRPGPTLRFVAFVEDVLLEEIADDIIIFIDEIDSILSLPFSDEFFTSLRSLYNARASNPALRRMTFVLLGVATASSFIRDERRTPFNIGRAITLKDFDQESTGAFKDVLGPDSEKLIDRIFYWTSGQPFLVQQLAAAVFSWPQGERTELRIDEQVKATYLDCKIDGDTHLKPIKDYLLAASNQTREILGIYRKVLIGKPVVENERSSAQSRLRLSGVVRTENERLVVRNRIYQSIFDTKWIRDNAPGLPRDLLLIISQIPVLLIGLGLWWWPAVRVQPIVAVLVGLFYELCVLTYIFRETIRYESEHGPRAHLIQKTRIVFANYLSSFRARYRRLILSKHGSVNTKGLGLINTYSLGLDQVFVNLRIFEGNPARFNIDPLSKVGMRAGRSIWDFLGSSRRGKKTNARVLAIIGPPGSGKTTLLQYMALTLAGGYHKDHHIEQFTPILLFLRDHVRAITQDVPPSLGTLVQNYFETASTSPGLKPPRGWFERELERGKCIVLLDGLDEVADIQQRRVVSGWVDNQIATYAKCNFVLTSRPQGYMDSPVTRADVLEVQPFNQTQVEQFIENWYLANEIRASGDLFTAETKLKASEDAANLLRRLRAVPSLGALTVNPLLLTMIAMVHRFYGALPGSRVGLYGSICEVLLDRWPMSKGVREEFSSHQKLTILRVLASFMMNKKLRSISVKQAADVVDEYVQQASGNLKSFTILLDELQAGSGLFLEHEAGYWSFAHLTFQEFLTADYWVNKNVTNQDWAKLISDSWWHETLRLYAAQSDASPIVRACLENNDVSSLALAADCLNEARELDPALRYATELRVIDALESNDPPTRSYAAEVRLLRRLNSMQRIDDNRWIDLNYLSCAEYQIFINEMQKQGVDHRPQHWSNSTFSPGEALNPITGIRMDDALAFCRWITQREDGNAVYRLPDENECKQYPSTSWHLGTWCTASRFRCKLIGFEEARNSSTLQNLRALSHLNLPDVEDLYEIYETKPVGEIARDLISSLQHSSDLASAVRVNEGNSPALARSLNFAMNRAIDLLFDLCRNQYDPIDVTPKRVRDPSTIGGAIVDLVKERNRVSDIAVRINLALVGESPDDFRLALKGIFLPSKSVIDLKVDRLYDINEVLEITHENALALASLLGMILEIGQEVLISHPASENEYAEVDTNSGSDVFIDSVLRHLEKWLAHDANVNRRGKLHAINLGDALLSYDSNVRLPILKLYWWLQIIKARKAGQLSAWEGIRLVKESS